MDARPNVLLIVTDDQLAATSDILREPSTTLEDIPATRRFFLEGGTAFTNAFAASCCASRASILTGRYAHNHGVLIAQQSRALREQTTLQYYFQQETDYRTGLVGRYLESWHLADDPPFFHDWASYTGQGERFNVNGTISRVVARPIQFMARFARRFIRATERQDERPWFLYVGASAPSVVGRPAGKSPAAQSRARQNEERRAVDDLVGSIVGALEQNDEGHATLAFYTSGSDPLPIATPVHRPVFRGGGVAHVRSSRVPLFVHWPGFVDAGVSDDSFVANIDVAPTIMTAAGLIADERYPVDGLDLLGPRREEIYLERRDNGSGRFGWRALLATRFLYVEHLAPGERARDAEYYDLVADPGMSENLLADADEAHPDLSAVREALEAYADCRGEGCVTTAD